MEEEPKLDRATFEFSQTSNCVSEKEYETITIECESSLGIDNDEGCFYVLKTDGWAVDDEQDLKKLFDRIYKVIKNE